ncbi:unnamed protein product [Ceutorhynchus assimilis]|uniref:Carboxylesterase type B domain-containing protein n=1 Tax=Ceutorhynchus assimilis TaxID=467358 RepID=A0A9N9QGA7_9CUCU|nr:unnamed protein product [Ceutorhynchus assimilis]
MHDDDTHDGTEYSGIRGAKHMVQTHSNGEARHPVIVYIHGESFEWNSGNPYDGSVLASYADLVVITLNYRLGILGFLNANPAPHLKARVANYGLMDQIAALHWIQQNIALFGGDPNNVTLAGHGSGAACINFLMISPTVMPGLFHRALLLSGSALSSWALVEDPVNYAVKLAREVNCSIPEDVGKDHEQIVDCLRETPLTDLLQADVTPPAYLSAFGPSVDGVVIKADFAKELVTYFKPQDLQSFVGPVNANMKRSEATLVPKGSNPYDLLFGVVTSEALWRFSSNDIQAGFEGERRDKIVRTYRMGTVHGEELPYMFGAPLVDGFNHFPRNYTRSELALSESFIIFIANFARTG